MLRITIIIIVDIIITIIIITRAFERQELDFSSPQCVLFMNFATPVSVGGRLRIHSGARVSNGMESVTVVNYRTRALLSAILSPESYDGIIVQSFRLQQLQLVAFEVKGARICRRRTDIPFRSKFGDSDELILKR